MRELVHGRPAFLFHFRCSSCCLDDVSVDSSPANPYAPLFPVQFCLNSAETQRNLLGATEKLVSVTYPTLVSKIPAIFNAYYSNDIIDEAVFFAWAADSGDNDYVSSKKHKQVVEAAAQFMEWLKVRGPPKLLQFAVPLSLFSALRRFFCRACVPLGTLVRIRF